MHRKEAAPTPTFYLYFLLVVIASCIVVFGPAIAFLVFEPGNDIREGVAYLKEIEKTLTQINNKLTLIEDDMAYSFRHRADKGREYLDSQKQQIRAAYEAGRQAYHEATTDKDDTTDAADPQGKSDLSS